MNTAVYAVIPRFPLAAAAVSLLAVAAYCALALRQIIRRSSEAEALSRFGNCGRNDKGAS